jgi:hypothetical protein
LSGKIEAQKNEEADFSAPRLTMKL